jgi:hypothetical protein
LDFLPLIESIESSEASVSTLFNADDGLRAPSRGSTSGRYKKLLREALDLYAAVIKGRKPAYYLQLAMTTSDFPVLFGDILDRQMLAEYEARPSNWRQFIKTRTVNDFREVEYRYFPDGQASQGRLQRVREQQEYPERSLEDMAKIRYRIGKFGSRMPLSWELLINDDTDYFARIPTDFGKAAVNTENYEALELFVSAAGPVAPFFSNGNGNLFTGVDSALSIASLQRALSAFANLKDDQGQPIFLDAAILVVPPALEVLAQNIINATEIEFTGVSVGEGNLGDADGARIKAANWLRNRVKVVVEPYLPIINQSASQNSLWFLFADPNSGRPAAEAAFLRGHESPQVFIKEPNARRVGGGAINPTDGDFDTDSVEYKVRHVFGGSRIEPMAAIASTGVAP